MADLGLDSPETNDAQNVTHSGQSLIQRNHSVSVNRECIPSNSEDKELAAADVE